MLKKIIAILILMLFLSVTIPSMGMINEKSNEISLCYLNTPPNPPIINGPASGKVRQNYVYDVTLTDPDIDDFLTNLEINFGEDESDVYSFHCSDIPWYNGTVIFITHSWKKTGTYEIRARAQDSYSDWSEWSDPFSVTIPKTKLGLLSLVKFLENHPNINFIIERIFYLL